MRFFALTVPGLGVLLRRELAAQVGLDATGEVEHDGRSDVVPFSAGPTEAVHALLAEDLFVELGTGDPAAPLRRLVGQLWSAGRYDAALPAANQHLGRLGPRPGFRVVARLRAERGFVRTDLRDELMRAVLRERPRWRPADPAPIELWALQTRTRRIRLGLRLSDRTMRQRSGREVERPGALRPVVAAAMLSLAPGAGQVLDPCCGSGTIVREALDQGRAAIGADLAADALAAARANLPARTPLFRCDAAALPLRSGTVGAVVTNLPFGRRHALGDQPARWLGQAFAELRRVVVPDRGGIVLLQQRSPEFEAAVLRPHRALLRSHHRVELLGLRTTIWVFRA